MTTKINKGDKLTITNLMGSTVKQDAPNYNLIGEAAFVEKVYPDNHWMEVRVPTHRIYANSTILVNVDEVELVEGHTP